MTRFTFQNGNVVIVENYAIGNALPCNAPSLKKAAEIALKEIKGGKAQDCAVSKTTRNGEFKDIVFQNGAILTIPFAYNITGYAQALDVVIKEIQ